MNLLRGMFFGLLMLVTLVSLGLMIMASANNAELWKVLSYLTATCLGIVVISVTARDL
jgi:hypothetical protein